jgi:tetratricopeptide (TPR) repeat protein
MQASRLRSFLLRVAAPLLLASSMAHAGQPQNITEAEMATLPPYCKDTSTFGSGDAYSNVSRDAPKWVAMMGKGFWSMHHYCWALINLSRIQRPSTPPVIKEGTREAAISDMNYVINYVPRDFVVLPEIYTKRGEVQLALNREGEALESFNTARTLKPDYWPAYYQWADHLSRTGRKAQARQVVKEGLAHAPQSRSLQRLLSDLGEAPARPRSANDAGRRSASVQ